MAKACAGEEAQSVGSHSRPLSAGLKPRPSPSKPPTPSKLDEQGHWAKQNLEKARLRSNMRSYTNEKKDKNHVAVSHADGNGSPARCTTRASQVVDQAGDGHCQWHRKKRPIPCERVKEGFHLAKEVGLCRESRINHSKTFS
jgi:hypothetical protein